MATARLVLSGCALMLAATPALPVEFSSANIGVRGSFDTTVSLGAAWRTQSRDPALVGIANGGTSRSVNDDDGNLNFDDSDLYSLAAKATHDLELSYANFGAFVRGTYFYDERANNNSAFGPVAHDRTGSDAILLDAFLRGTFNIAGNELNARLGRQVISWGESTFIPNSINVINPVNVAALRVPGAELKEALVPSPIAWASQQIGDQFTVEGFYIFTFDETRIDPRGTFFSTNDFVSDDGNEVFVGIGRRRDRHVGLPGQPPLNALSAAAPTVRRIADRTPDKGQYGFALRYFAEALNDTEFGFYHMLYHNRTPIASAIRGVGVGGGAAPTSRYFVEYPGDISLYGASFNTLLPFGVALQGEYSYRNNQPLQLHGVDLVLAVLGLPNAITGNSIPQASSVAPGTEISGFRRVPMQQAQFTVTKAFGPTLGSQQFVAVAEVGYTHLSLPDGLFFAGPGTALPSTQAGANLASGGSVQNGGFVTSNSWGYRLVTRMDFNNAIGPATVSPRIAFGHDVDGVSPTFNERTKALTFGININYLENWQADIAYTNFFGGRTYSGTDPIAASVPPGQSASFATSANPIKDRDFISASISYSF